MGWSEFFFIDLILLVALFPYFDWASNINVEYAVAQLVEALRYKPEGRGFDSRWNY
jgi:hypothetical protein